MLGSAGSATKDMDKDWDLLLLVFWQTSAVCSPQDQSGTISMETWRKYANVQKAGVGKRSETVQKMMMWM